MKTVTAKPAKATKASSAKVGKNTKKIKDSIEELDIIEPLDDDDEPEVHHGELDPEVIEALNIKKKVKVKGVKSVDYIPELEREDSYLDDSFGGNM